ncbi:MAG: phytanoyl-CoA dioxygenase family protein [Chloracidobacterium sp.]|nr:phytanoyl-CoA dioxygenase family protein [Chloracidobacterium sp.]
MNSDEIALSANEKNRLDLDGFLVLENFVEAGKLADLRRRVRELFAELGDRAGFEFRQEPQTDRLANLVEYGEIFRWAIAEPKLLACVKHTLGPDFKLSSLNARSTRPYSDWTQPLHCDGAALPDEKGNSVCNVIWLLDDFTTENGAPRYLPGSHKSGRLPQDVLPNPSAAHPDEVLITGRAGDVIVMNAHLWHGGTANRSGGTRMAMHSFYCRRDLPQQQYQKKLLSPGTQRSLSQDLRRLLALDDPLNDELSGASSGRSGFLK